MPDDETDKEFERVWENADWMFKNDKQDAKYFWLKGRQIEIVNRQLEELNKREREVDNARSK